MSKMVFSGLIFLASMAGASAKYGLDTSHSEIGFSVKHLMISNVKGRFNKFEGSFEYDEKTKKVSGVDIKVEVASVDTNDKKRDEHLVSADFFDAAKNPTLTFKADKIENVVEGKTFKVPGTLTIKGITKPVSLEVKFAGAAKDPWGNEKVVFSASTSLNRNDYGVSWNKKLDKGGVVVGDEVKVTIEAEANKAADPAAAKTK